MWSLASSIWLRQDLQTQSHTQIHRYPIRRTLMWDVESSVISKSLIELLAIPNASAFDCFRIWCDAQRELHNGLGVMTICLTIQTIRVSISTLWQTIGILCTTLSSNFNFLDHFSLKDSLSIALWIDWVVFWDVERWIRSPLAQTNFCRPIRRMANLGFIKTRIVWHN